MGDRSTKAACGSVGGSDGGSGLDGERAEAVLDRIGDAIYALDRNLRLTYVNRAFERMCGRSRAELIGRHVFDLFPRSVGSECHEAHLRALRENRPVRYETLSTLTGRWVEATIHPDALGLSVCMRDLTDRKRQEEALRASRRFIERVADVCPAVLYVYDVRTDRTVYYNRDRKGTLGYTDDEVAAMEGRRQRLLVHPDDYARRPDHIARLAALPDGETVAVEYRMRRKDGSWAWLYGEWTVFERDETGAVVQILGSALDISERRRAEEHQRLLVGELSHRVKNMLAVVQAMASQSLRRVPSMEAFAESFSSRLRALAAAHGLLTRTKWQPIELRAVVDQITKPYDDGTRLAVDGPTVPLLPGQTLSLGLVLHELVANAAKHGALSVPSGQVRICWRLRDGDTPRLRLEWIEDGGPRAAPPTTDGFGLTMIRGAVAHDLGGRVCLSFPPEGLRCEIHLPAPGGLAPGPANP